MLSHSAAFTAKKVVRAASVERCGLHRGHVRGTGFAAYRRRAEQSLEPARVDLSDNFRGDVLEAKNSLAAVVFQEILGVSSGGERH